MIAVQLEGKPLLTPGKKSLEVPTKALSEAIAQEWAGAKKFTPTGMPLSALAYTAIDRIDAKRDDIIEALMIYLDTDTLSYMQISDGHNKALAERQKRDWVPIHQWAAKEFGAIWQTTQGLDAAVQAEAMHTAVRAYLATLSSFQLAAFCVLAPACSSLLLGLAVLKKRLDAEDAYMLSRLEEEVQAERWGRVDEAEQSVSRVKAEIQGVSRFLRLLEAA